MVKWMTQALCHSSCFDSHNRIIKPCVSAQMFFSLHFVFLYGFGVVKKKSVVLMILCIKHTLCAMIFSVCVFCGRFVLHL